MLDNLRAHELPPGFEPDPPLERYPEGLNRRSAGFENEIIGSGKFRWCACRVFGYYQAGDKFGQLIKPGETVSLGLLRECDSVTRRVFAIKHQSWVGGKLAACEAFGYKVCLLPDTTPRGAFEVGAEFGLNVEAYYSKRDRETAAVARRKARFAAMRANHPDRNRATLAAEDISRLI